MGANKTMTVAQVREKSRIKKLLPTRDDFKGKKGYREFDTPLPDGSTWEYRWQPNEQGKATRESGFVGEAMRDFQKADIARHEKNQSHVERAVLKDQDGGTRFVDAALAENTARQNGWSHSWRAGGARVERGVDGMLWRKCGDGWEPLGVRCLGTPLYGKRTVPCKGLQRDPDGNSWRGLGKLGWAQLL